MNLPDMQGADGAAVIIYCKPFRNAADQAKASRPKGDNLRKQMGQKTNKSLSNINISKISGANCHEIFGVEAVAGLLSAEAGFPLLPHGYSLLSFTSPKKRTSISEETSML